ncbi:MAG: hypothetical protein AB4062_13270 [Crocosphaera sp.]
MQSITFLKTVRFIYVRLLNTVVEPQSTPTVSPNPSSSPKP